MGWRDASNYISVLFEPYSSEIQIQDANAKTFNIKYQYQPQIQSQDWFVTIDRDACFRIKIFPKHRKFIQFCFWKQRIPVLPFIPTLLPCAFTKCMDTALALLQLQGIHVLNYIDDWPILAQ